MITLTDKGDGTFVPAMSFVEIYDMDGVKGLRDVLMEVLEICVSFQEAKDASNPYHLYLLSCLIKELTKDLEHKEKGGNV